MSAAATQYAELEVGLQRLAADTYQVELRFSDPTSETEVTPEKGPVTFDLAELLSLQLDPKAYGEALAAQVFAANPIRLLYAKVKTAVEKSGLFMRLRLRVGPTAPELNGLRWELLCDPETKAPIATSERILFSRFMASRDWRPVKLRPKADLRALIAVSAPADLDRYGLAPVKLDAEIARGQKAVGGIRNTVLGRDEPLTLERLVDQLRQGVDLLYLVCHGVLVRGQSPFLLQDDAGGGSGRSRRRATRAAPSTRKTSPLGRPNPEPNP